MFYPHRMQNKTNSPSLWKWQCLNLRKCFVNFWILSFVWFLNWMSKLICFYFCLPYHLKFFKKRFNKQVSYLYLAIAQSIQMQNHVTILLLASTEIWQVFVWQTDNLWSILCYLIRTNQSYRFFFKPRPVNLIGAYIHFSNGAIVFCWR